MFVDEELLNCNWVLIPKFYLICCFLSITIFVLMIFNKFDEELLPGSLQIGSSGQRFQTEDALAS